MRTTQVATSVATNDPSVITPPDVAAMIRRCHNPMVPVDFVMTTHGAIDHYHYAGRTCRRSMCSTKSVTPRP